MREKAVLYTTHLNDKEDGYTDEQISVQQLYILIMIDGNSGLWRFAQPQKNIQRMVSILTYMRWVRGINKK